MQRLARLARARIRLIAGIAMLLAAPLVSALPDDFVARFDVVAQGLHIASSNWELRTEAGGERVYTTRSESVGIARMLRDQQVEETSRFTLHENRVRPVRYRYQRTGKKPRSAGVDFDWGASVGRNEINGEQWTMPLERGLQDKLSYVMAIAQSMLRDGAPPASVSLSDGGKLKTYHLVLVGEESRDTPLGTLATKRVRRTSEGEARTTDLWLAPKLGFLPVHIEHREDGEVVRVELRELERR